MRLLNSAGTEIANGDDECDVCARISGVPEGLASCEMWTLRQGCWGDLACGGQSVVQQFTFTGDDDYYGDLSPDDGPDDAAGDDDEGYCFPPDMLLGLPVRLDAYHKTTLGGAGLAGSVSGRGNSGGNLNSVFAQSGVLVGAVTGGAVVLVMVLLVAGVVKIAKSERWVKMAQDSGEMDVTESGEQLMPEERWDALAMMTQQQGRQQA